MSEVKLLPLPGWMERYVLPANDFFDQSEQILADLARDYARANMEPLLAENERLRAEVAKRDGIDPWAVLLRAQEAEARAERMTDALRECVKDMQRTEDYYGEHPDAQAVISKARAALDQEGGNE